MDTEDVKLTKPINLKNVAVIGAGTMGSAIAQHFLMKGMHVNLLDLSQESIDRGVSLIVNSLEEALKRKIISNHQKDEILSKLMTTSDFNSLSDSQLCVEAVYEDLDVKINLFKELEKFVPANCVLGTNTSTFFITEIASYLENPERFVGIHYFYHAAKNKLIEIIPGEKTDPQLADFLSDFYTKIDKIPILVGDRPGFAVNRFFVPWLNEGARLYEEGLGSMSEIDEIACEVFSIGMGPFALMNATGVPIAVHAANYLAEKLGPFYKPADSLVKQVDSGRNWDIASSTGDSANKKMISERLLGVTFGIASQMVSEGVTDPTSTDTGALVGLKWTHGPFELMKKIGINESIELVKKVFHKWDMPLPLILSETDSTIKLNYVKTKVIGEIGYIEFNRPDRMNALDPEVMEQLSNSFIRLDSDPNIRSIIFHGKGKAFVAGADIKFFVENIKSNKIQKIKEFTEFGQELFNSISISKKRTIAYLDGLTLGGGAELALACDHRVGTEKTAIGFPETGIGIYPGLGGTQRLPRLIGKAIAKYLISTGNIIDSKKALEYGLIDRIVDRNLGISQLEDVDLENVNGKRNSVLPETEFREFNGKLSEGLLEKEIFVKSEKALKRKAPLALSKAMELIDEGEKLNISDALKLELDALPWIFSTKDALTGLESIINRNPPQFDGE